LKKINNKMNMIQVKGMIFLVLMTISGIVNAQGVDEGIKLYKYERFESARKILEPLAASNPLANYYLGLAEIALENTGTAKTIFQRYPDDVANATGIARVMFLENKAPEAMGMLTKSASKAKKKDWTPYKYAADAITYTEGGDLNQAVEWYKKALEVERTGEVYIAMGDAYRKMQGGGGNAMSNYEYADEFANVKSLANYKMGDLWYAAKNYDSALTMFKKSSALDESNPLPYRALAEAYYRVKKFSISKENIEKYLELSDKTTDDMITYANTLFLAKEYASAITKMNELVSKGLGDKRPYMYRVLGYSQYETKDYGNALQNMDKLFAKQDPKKLIFLDYMYYGKILMTDTTKAVAANESFKKGIAMDTAADKAPLYREIAEAYFNKENYPMSALWYKTLVESKAPGIDDRDYWWAGYMSFYSGDYVTSEQMFTAYNQKDTTQPLSVLWLARVNEKAKDSEFKTGLAVPFYTKWLSMVKEDDPSKKKDLVKAFTYLAMVGYTANKKEDAQLYADKLLAIDPANDTGLQLQNALKSMK
jgi:tetratricopeptide (TPR) repeat protein